MIRFLIFLYVLTGVCLISSCQDYGDVRGDEAPNPLHVESVNIDEGSRFSVKRNIEIRFDRYLSQDTVTRQTIYVLDADNRVTFAPLVVYEPVTRTVSLRNADLEKSSWLKNNAYYKLVVAEPGKDGKGGIRSVDGGGLESSVVKAFLTKEKENDVDETVKSDEKSNISYCRDIAPILAVKCSQCHSENKDQSPALGLRLDTKKGLQDTAIRQVSRLMMTGPSNAPKEVSASWGENLRIIEPQNPGRSLLIYKVLLAPPQAPGSAFPRCVSPYGEPLSFPDVSMGNASSEAISELSHHVLGRVMPFGGGDNHTPLSVQERLSLSLWIAEGANLSDCPNLDQIECR